MNATIIGMVCIFVIAIFGAVLRYLKKSIKGIVLYIIGLISLSFGVYLLPATMWRTISTGFLIIGIVFELVATFIIINHKIKNS